jgi:hypothetical protein
MPISNINAMKKSNKPANTGAMGRMIRGRYTFDIKFVLDIKLFPELVIEFAKYVHATIAE